MNKRYETIKTIYILNRPCDIILYSGDNLNDAKKAIIYNIFNADERECEDVNNELFDFFMTSPQDITWDQILSAFQQYDFGDVYKIKEVSDIDYEITENEKSEYEKMKMKAIQQKNMIEQIKRKIKERELDKLKKELEK